MNIQQRLEHNMRAKFSYIASKRDDMAVIEKYSGILVNANIACDMFNVIADINVKTQAELNELLNYFSRRGLNVALWTGFSNETKETKQILAQTQLPEVEKEVGIWDVITHPDARRQKIGTTMMWAMINQLKKEYYTDVVLTASEEGLLVYEKMGFQRCPDVYRVYNISAEKTS